MAGSEQRLSTLLTYVLNLDLKCLFVHVTVQPEKRYHVFPGSGLSDCSPL